MKLLIVAIILVTGQIVMAGDEEGKSDLPWDGHIIDDMQELIYGKKSNNKISVKIWIHCNLKQSSLLSCSTPNFVPK